ncbi:YcdB/YcdC domain-containing protein [Alkaliphilus transvaalensis]|uniref:YcdB/YcdC domain-containing protein n=1 Tax=Alkaliphilus transvaalensis TaxID=114628 RepID=UPI00047C45FE|nr:YcdB/YcdC domain-containing protein [Alkaliphilus transvaalensis]
MGHLKKYGILILLVISLTFNLTNFLKLKDVNQKMEETNKVVSQQVERGIRQSMRLTDELIDNQSQQTLQTLQRSMQDLTLSFGHWLNINQTERSRNKRLERGLSGIESMRNVVVHHLNNQYTAKNNLLDEYDIELLRQVYDNLDRLLKVYYNINERLPELKISNNSDGGLEQVAANIEEMTRLYRHSIVPNHYPNYVSLQGAVEEAYSQFPKLKELKLEDHSEIQIRDGVHSYQLKFIDQKELVYTVAVDAINLGIRNYEVHRESEKRSNVSRQEALKIAEEFLQQFYQEDVVTEFFELAEAESSKIYAFRFTPVIEEIKVVSDAFNINVSCQGEVVKYTNEFIGSNHPNYTIGFTTEEIIEKDQEVHGELQYEGLSIIRSFLTRYRPKMAYTFRVISNEQQMLVFYDVETGNQIYNLYYIYEEIE